jgi:hypothetical protein
MMDRILAVSFGVTNVCEPVLNSFCDLSGHRGTVDRILAVSFALTNVFEPLLISFQGCHASDIRTTLLLPLQVPTKT